MKPGISYHKFICFLLIAGISLALACGGKTNFLSKASIPLKIEEVDLKPGNETGGGTGGGGTGGGGTLYQDINPCHSSLHCIFNGVLGMPVSATSMSALSSDATGFTLINDFDGDGIPNDLEIITNKYVTDYPRIVTRVTTPIVMSLRISETDETQNFTESIEESDVKETITNSMENKHYNQLNQKTTPVPTKESQSTSESSSFSRGEENSYGMGGGIQTPWAGVNFNYNEKHANNMSIASSFSQSTMSEKTIFEDVNYQDNLDRNGVEFKNDTVQNMTKNYRQSEKTKSTYTIDPNVGYVRAGLFIKNDSVDIPVRISNLTCTLAFKTPGGAILPVKSFRLRNDDYSEFEKDIYGGEELGPYALEVTGLNTYEVKEALKNGYVPQIYIVDYEVRRVDDSNYNPGVDNLKIVEETAKGRTAMIKVIGTNYRDTYRVAAFDQDDYGVSPGISLKKALFTIFADRTSGGEDWKIDSMGNSLTVEDSGLKWKSGFDPHDAVNKDKIKLNDQYEFNTSNLRGNTWRLFETYVKNYVDEYNQTHRIETIKRIGPLNAYNPFSAIDNPNYNPNEFMAQEEVMKMKYWIILHNGRYFEGDINDPIWAGERYELICIDIRDFNAYFQLYYYSPVQSQEFFSMNTSWNKLNNAGELARAKYLGRLIMNDVVHIELNLKESKFLFDTAYDQNAGIKKYHPLYNSSQELTGKEWYKFDYTFQPPSQQPQGIPNPFSHYAEGGFNCLKVNISESKNAQSYEVKFREKGNIAAEWKKVKVYADDLKYNNNDVYINQHTRDIDGNKVGFIDGALLSANGRTYEVQVRARGLINDVELYTNSMTNGMADGEAVVYSVDAGTLASGDTNNDGIADGFTFSAAGMTDNQIYVRIANASYTEYFEIICHGPYNYANGTLQPPLDDATAPVLPAIYGHAGLNKITLNSPVNPDRPGVYKIEVKAINSNSSVTATNGWVPAVVEHDRYAAQRDSLLAPRTSQAFFDKSAIDLEVNFNDGSGWYRLKLSNMDKGARRIDCRHSSYYEYDKQKFHIYFKAPAGGQDEYSQKYAEGHDVFAGGRQEVELYVRTVAEQRYRDTFWMKKQYGDDNFNENLNYIITEPGITDFAGYWINSDLSDASNIENSLALYGVATNGTYSSGVELKGNNIFSYFFSPLEMRNYDIKVRLEEQLPSRFIYELDPPSFRAFGADRSIKLSDINSMYADWYEVYYKEITNASAPVVGVNENPLLSSLWVKYAQNVIENNNQDYSLSLDLLPNKNYGLVVLGKNQDGTVIGQSKPVYYNGSNGSARYSDATMVWVFEDTPPADAPTIGSLYVRSDNYRAIQVDNLYLNGEVRYQIWWKRDIEQWSQASYYDTKADGGKLEFGPVSYTITAHKGLPLEVWRQYTIRVRAITSGDQAGPWSAEYKITTGTNGAFSIGNTSWANVRPVVVSTYPFGANYYEYSDLYINHVGVPEGTVTYQITGTVWVYPESGYRPYPSFDISQNCNPGVYPILLSNSIVLQSYSTNQWFYSAQNVVLQLTVTAYNENGLTIVHTFPSFSLGLYY